MSDAGPSVEELIAAARRDCIARLQETAVWLETGAMDRDALRACGHRLHGTAGSYGFAEIARLAWEMEEAAPSASEAALADRRRDLAAALRRLGQ